MSRARHAPINFHPAASLPSKTRPEQIQVQPHGGMERRRAGIAPLEAHRHAQAPVTGTFGLQITARARSSPCEDPPQELASSNSCCRPRSSCREAQGDGQQRPGALFLLSCSLSAPLCSPHIFHCTDFPSKDELDMALLAKNISPRLLFGLNKFEGVASEKSVRSFYGTIPRFIPCIVDMEARSVHSPAAIFHFSIYWELFSGLKTR